MFNTSGEFPIRSHASHGESRTRDYWSHGYSLSESLRGSSLEPTFQKIFQCGKAVNLLKIEKAEHSSRRDWPVMKEICCTPADFQHLRGLVGDFESPNWRNPKSKRVSF